MKKHLTISLLLSISLVVYSQTQRLIIKTEIDSTQLRYRSCDGKQLPFYNLHPTITMKRGTTVTFNLPDSETMYKLTNNQKTFQIYATANATDTLYLYQDSVSFHGDNQMYYHYLAEAEKADAYCRDYTRSRNHPLSKVTTLSEFTAIISSREANEHQLLTNSTFTASFKQQQHLSTDMRYKALLLKKIISLHQSSHLTDEWMEAFKKTDFHLNDEASRKSEWFYELLKDYVCIQRFIIERQKPEDVAGQIPTFFFNNYLTILNGGALEYAISYLFYDDIFQKEYSKEIPSLYKKFVSLFPNSHYTNILAPGIETITALYNKSNKNNKIHMANYEQEPGNFADIIRPFLGKVVYIDIWATTCSPCLQSLSEAEAIKKKITCADDIVFFYISVDRDNSHEKWKSLISYYNLEGYHYRVNKQTAPIIYSTFGDSRGILSIPRYILIDKEGKVAFAHAAPLADTQKVTEQIQSLLKK